MQRFNCQRSLTKPGLIGTHANDDFIPTYGTYPLDCNGIKSDFVDEGAKTVIPCDGFFNRLINNVQIGFSI